MDRNSWICRVSHSAALLNWPRIIWTLVGVVVVALVCYTLVYLPLAKKLILNERDQFMWNVFALLLTMWCSFQFARMSFRRDVLREVGATARGALNRIFEAEAGVTAVTDNIGHRLSQLEGSPAADGSSPDPQLRWEALTDIQHQVSMVANILRYAVLDWKSILPEDFERQQYEEAEFVEAQREISRLKTQLDRTSAELEEERGAKAEAGTRNEVLMRELQHIRQQIAEEARKAAAATREAPFPMGTASRGVISKSDLDAAERAFLRDRERSLQKQPRPRKARPG